MVVPHLNNLHSNRSNTLPSLSNIQNTPSTYRMVSPRPLSLPKNNSQPLIR